MASRADYDMIHSFQARGVPGAGSDGHRWHPAQRQCDTELISSAQLIQFLGGHGALTVGDSGGAHDAMMGVKLALSPGDVLYKQGSDSPYVYVLESGLVQCLSQQPGLGLPETVSHAGAKEWLGLYDQPHRRQETVRAVTHTSLLALPMKALNALRASSPLIAELHARRTSMALKRDWRTVYRLRDLPAYTRTVMGLVYLVSLADPERASDQNAPSMEVVLDMGTLAHWLGLPLAELGHCLMQLQRYGALSIDLTRIIDLSPQVLFSVSSSMAYLSKGKYMAEPVLAPWKETA